MNQRFTNVIIAAANMVFWGVITEVLVAITGKTATPHGWLTAAVMCGAFLGTLAALNWLTSETR